MDLRFAGRGAALVDVVGEGDLGDSRPGRVERAHRHLGGRGAITWRASPASAVQCGSRIAISPVAGTVRECVGDGPRGVRQAIPRPYRGCGSTVTETARRAPGRLASYRTVPSWLSRTRNPGGIDPLARTTAPPGSGPKPTTLRNGEDGLFTKPAVADYPDYLRAACAGDPNGSCTTIHYKSATRANIESLGYDIVANFGDQFSDLEGGHARRTFKLPNPNYFLP